MYCLNIIKKRFCKNTHKPRQMCWGAAKGRALSPPWWVRWSSLPLGLASTLRRLTPQLQLESFIRSAELWGRGGTDSGFERSKSTPPFCVEGQRQKVWQDTHRLRHTLTKLFIILAKKKKNTNWIKYALLLFLNVRFSK